MENATAIRPGDKSQRGATQIAGTELRQSSARWWRVLPFLLAQIPPRPGPGLVARPRR